MTARQRFPTSYADFFTQAFGKNRPGGWASDYLFEAAEVIDAVDTCNCGRPVINLTAFVEGVGEHYVLTDEQRERLEEELEGCGAEVSDDGVCSEHAEA